jgi:SAM-dependent methyltransferase
VCGVDLDARVAGNPYLDEGKVGSAEKIPYPDASFDVVFSDNVLEHLEKPGEVMKEVRRVLKPGGVFLAKTPNRRHYMPVIAQLTPHAFHRFVKSLMGVSSEDTFPTRYRINTPGEVRRYAASAGLEVEEIKLMEGRPEYLRLWFPTYLVGFLYERMVNLPAFAAFRILLVIRLRKP